MKELLVLEAQCYEQQKWIQKAMVLTDVIRNKKELTKKSISHIINDQTRIDQINKALASKGSVDSKKVKRQKKPKLKN